MKLTCLCGISLLCACALLSGIAPAYAFDVTNDNDDGPGSLRQAIIDANTATGSQAIAFSGAIGTIHLSSALPTVTCTPTFDLSGATGTVSLEGNTMDFNSVPSVFNGGTLSIGSGSGMTGMGALTVADTATAALNVLDGCTLSNTSSLVGSGAGVSGTITVDGAGSTWTNSSGVTVGNSGTGTVNILNAGAVSGANGYVGKNAGSDGTVSVDGPGSAVSLTGTMQIGGSGTGTVDITNGATVNCSMVQIGSAAGSTGSITINGSNSELTTTAGGMVGVNGTATMDIEDGGKVTFNGDSYIGMMGVSSGTVTVTGTGSTLAMDSYNDLYVGWRNTAQGILNITNGAAVTVDYGDIRIATGYRSTDAPTGTVTVDGAGSTLTVEYMLEVGAEGKGTGTLNITNGAAASSATGEIGYSSGSNCTVTVDGAGSTWTTNGYDLRAGCNGTGTVTISNGGKIACDTVLLAGNAAGTGTLNIGSGGAAGTLEAAEVNGGSGTATLNFNHTDVSYSFSPDITGTLALKHTGTGRTTLTGQTTYTGDTTISAGILDINQSRSLAGDVTLNGTGSLDVRAGTLTHTGTYTQNANTTLRLTANSAASYGNIVSSGSAVVDAASILNVTVGGYMPNGTTLTVIDAAPGAGVNAPGTVVSSNSKYTFAASVLNGDLFLTVNRAGPGAGYEACASNSNANNVAVVLDNVTNPTGDMLTALDTLDGLSASQTGDALNSLVPEVDNGIVETSRSSLNNFIGTTLERMENVLRRYNPSGPGAGPTGVSTGDEQKLNSIWVDGYGSYLSQKSRKDVQGYNAWNAGTVIGLDRIFFDSLMLGAGGGYAYGHVASKANAGKTAINSAQVTLYGGYQRDDCPFYCNLTGSFGRNWYTGTRDISVGAISRRANADYTGNQYDVYAGSGYTFSVYNDRLRFTPLVSLQWDHLSLGSYTETEAGALGLQVDRQGYDILQSGAGLSISVPAKFKGCVVTPEAHGKWLYDFIGDSMTVTSAFTGGGASFNANGIKPPRNSFNAGAGLTVDFDNGFSVIGDCDTEMREDFFGIYGSIIMRYNF